METDKAWTVTDVCYYSGPIMSAYTREIKASPRGEAVHEADWLGEMFYSEQLLITIYP